jgi:hypothetical protein
VTRLAPLSLILLAVLATTPSAASASAHRTVRPANQTSAAATLVRGITGAKATKARASALLAVMNAVHIQVVTRAGKPLVISPERGAARQYALYDFELTALAGQYGRKQTFTLDEFAARLQRLGVTYDATHALPASVLRDSLVAAAKSAAKAPKVPNSILPDVVRDLGVAHGYDLTKAPAASAIKLDPVQAYLVMSDFVIPFLRQVPAQSGTAAHKTLRSFPTAPIDPTASAASLSDICAKLDKASEKYDDALGQDDLDKTVNQAFGGGAKGWVAEKGLGKIRSKTVGFVQKHATEIANVFTPLWAQKSVAVGSKALEAAGIILDGAHAVVVADSFEAKSLDQLLTTHWGHNSPGKQLVFRVLVTMKDDLGDKAVKCGKLLGAEIPPPGPVAGVPIVFEQVFTKLTPTDGTWDCSDLACQKKTGSNGIASVTFTPKVETELAGVGRQKTNTGVIDGIALPAQGLKSGILAKIFQVAFLHFDGTRWEVTHHEAPQLTLTYDHTTTDDLQVQTNTCSFSGTSTFHTDWALQTNIALAHGADATQFTGSDTLRWLKAQRTDHESGTAHYYSSCAEPTCNVDTLSTQTYGFSAPASVVASSITSDAGGAHVNSVDFDPGPTHETFHTAHSGDCGGDPEDLDETSFLNDFGSVHSAERTSASRVIHITGWTPGTGNVLATKTYSVTDPEGAGGGSYVDVFKIVESYPAG